MEYENEQRKKRADETGDVFQPATLEEIRESIVGGQGYRDLKRNGINAIRDHNPI